MFNIDLNSLANSPVLLIVVVLVGLFFPRLGQLGPIIAAALRFLAARLAKPTDPTKPVDPSSPVTVPPASPDHPLINSAIELLKRLAHDKFPWLAADQALIEYAADQLRTEGAAVEARAKATAPVNG